MHLLTYVATEGGEGVHTRTDSMYARTHSEKKHIAPTYPCTINIGHVINCRD